MNSNSAERVKELASAPVGKLLWKYSLPAVVGTVVMALYHIIDSMVIGHAVPDPNVVAGIAVSFPVMNIATAFGMLIGAGAATRVSIVMGQNDHNRAAWILGNSVQLTILVGLFYTTALAIFINPILDLFGASDATRPYAREFLLWLLPGMVLINLTFSYNNVMRASGYPGKAMFTSIIGAVLNVILAPLFLFGFGWGVKGAALATDISMIITAFFVMAHFFDKRSVLHFEKGTFKFNWPIIRSVLYIGMAPFLINVTSAGINAIINNSLLKYGGDNAIAAVVVFNRYVTIFVFIVMGICQGMQPILGYNFGARKFDRLFKTLKLAVAFALSFTTLGSIIGATIPDKIASMFMTDAQQIESAVICLRITTLTFWVVGFQIVSTNFFQSLGKAGKAVFLSLTRQVIFMLPMLLILPPIFGLKGVWACFPICDVISAVVAGFMLAWQIRHIRTTPQTEP
ncbi:MAG: MATE family efflux transporter [Muribaculaceae bacterium]|nr:MATE family efflux transporter [Muribaculaceae bacterium]